MSHLFSIGQHIPATWHGLNEGKIVLLHFSVYSFNSNKRVNTEKLKHYLVNPFWLWSNAIKDKKGLLRMMDMICQILTS